MVLFRCWKDEVQRFSEGSEARLRWAILSAFRLEWLLPGIILLFAVGFYMNSFMLSRNIK